MLALRETFRVFTINAFFIFERPFVAAGACAYMGFGWHMDAGMRGCGDARIYYIYIHRKNKKVVLYRGLCPPLTPWPTALRFA